MRVDIEDERLYYLCSENKGTDQLCGYRRADLCLCLRLCKNRFHICKNNYSHDAAHFFTFMRFSWSDWCPTFPRFIWHSIDRFWFRSRWLWCWFLW